jgi:hypothetical protein
MSYALPALASPVPTVLHRLPRVAFLACVALAMLVVTRLASAADRGPSNFAIYTEIFDSNANVTSFWQPQSGSWSVTAGTYNGNSTPASIATMYQYPPFPGDPAPRLSVYPVFDFEVRLRTPPTQNGSVGVLFSFQDISHYSEIVFAANGTMEVRDIINGVPTLRAAGDSLGFGPNEWIDVKITRRSVRLTATNSMILDTIWLNGDPLLREIQSGGNVGVIAHDAPATVDHVLLSIPAGDQPFREDFGDGFFNAWRDLAEQSRGQWSVANGTFNSTTVQQTSVAVLPISPSGGTTAFTLRARMLNPYGARGNQVGIIFNHHPFFGRHHELVFLPNGVARVNFVSNGIVQTLASASYPGRPNVWFDVVMQMESHLDVGVNGRALFAGIETRPLQIDSGGVGLLTHWAPGRFDNVRLDLFSITPLSENFSAGLPQSATRVGTWNTNGGTLNATSVGNTDLVTFGCACWKTDYVYRGRLLNEYGARGNLVGLIYSYQEPTDPAAGDYYEVVFAPTGQAYLNKVVNGVRYRMASAAHNVPHNTWFDVELIRSSLDTMLTHSSINTTVKVNGRTIFSRVPQGQFGFGRVGVITHWARGRFDNLSIKPLLTQAP